MNQVSKANLFLVGLGIAAFSAAAVYYLRPTAMEESKWLLYLPWLVALAIGSLWSPLLPVGTAIVMLANADFAGFGAAAMYIAFLATCARHFHSVSVRTFSVPGFLFVFLMVVSCYWAVDPEAWIRDDPVFLYKTGPFILLGFAIAVLVSSDPGRLRFLLWTVVGGATLGAFEVIRNYALGKVWGSTRARYEGLIGADTFSTWSMLAGVILIHEMSSPRRSMRWRVLSGGGAGVMTLATLFTGTRSGMVGLLGGCMVLAFTFRHMRRFLIIALGVAAITYAAFRFVPTLSSHLEERLGESAMEQGVEGRLELWRVALPMFFERPLLGVGWSNVPLSMELHGSTRSSAHNTYITVLIELGLAGSVVFVWWLFVLFWRAREGEYGLVLRAILAALLLQGFFLNQLYYPYYWMVIGFVEGWRRYLELAGSRGGVRRASNRPISARAAGTLRRRYFPQ